MELTEVIKRPILTEKSRRLVARNQYAFEVRKDATKRDTACAVEKLFGVEVYNVTIQNRRGKTKRRGKTRLEKVSPLSRRAMVTINPEQKIKLFEEEK